MKEIKDSEPLRTEYAGSISPATERKSLLRPVNTVFIPRGDGTDAISASSTEYGITVKICINMSYMTRFFRIRHGATGNYVI